MITGRINQNSRAHVVLIVGRGAADFDGASDGPPTVARLPCGSKCFRPVRARRRRRPREVAGAARPLTADAPGQRGASSRRTSSARAPTPADERRTVRLLGDRRSCQTPAPCFHSACTTNVRDRADARPARRPFSRLARSPANAGERQPFANVPTFVVDSFAGCERLQRAARRTQFRDVDRPPARQSVKGVGCGWRSPESVRPVTDL